MPHRLWGCYSVADHLEHRAFVADLLLYDRLVIPVPTADDIARWKERWDPERQARLLEILGCFAEPLEWDFLLRREFNLAWSARRYAQNLNGLNALAAKHDYERPDYYRTSHGVIVSHMTDQVLKEQGNIRAIAVYAQPDRFNRDWELIGTPPFIRRVTRVRPGALREVTGFPLRDQHRLAKVVINRLVVPDEGKTDEEVLKRTVDLMFRAEVPKRRAAFHQLLASLTAEGLRDETIIGEIDDLLNAFNESIRRHSAAWRMRVAVQFVTTGMGVAALWAPPVRVATGPTTAVAEMAIRHRRERSEDQKTQVELDAATLLAEAQDALNGNR